MNKPLLKRHVDLAHSFVAQSDGSYPQAFAQYIANVETRAESVTLEAREICAASCVGEGESASRYRVGELDNSHSMRAVIATLVSQNGSWS